VNRSDLLGWTLAEIAFAVLFALLAALLPSYKIAVQRNLRLDTENKKTALVTEELKKVKEQNAVLQKAVDESRKNLRSRVLPSCAEKDRTPEWLFTATITSGQTYTIDGQQYTIPALLQKYGTQVEAARKRECVEQVRIYYKTGISARDYDEGFRRLGQLFYPMSLGEK
jgi:hypothetical protein